MSMRECNHVDEQTGFKCRKPFKVTSHNYRRYRCDEHLKGRGPKRNSRLVAANLAKSKVELRQYVEDLRSEIIPDILVRYVETMHEIDNLTKKVDEIKLPKIEDIVNNSPELSLDLSNYKLEVKEFYDDMGRIHNAYVKRTKTQHSNSLAEFRELKSEIDETINEKLDSFSLESEVTKRFANQINIINNRNIQLEKRIKELENKLS